mmetsp:Transcript_30172/g.58957  ORF Transcript_30172/g.58957 Transcript_30172/m.58957 type:complete len:117 (-) Transcript_30172:359-709(-)
MLAARSFITALDEIASGSGSTPFRRRRRAVPCKSSNERRSEETNAQLGLPPRPPATNDSNNTRPHRPTPPQLPEQRNKGSSTTTKPTMPSRSMELQLKNYSQPTLTSRSMEVQRKV